MNHTRFVLSNAREDSTSGMDVVSQARNLDSSLLSKFRFTCSKLLKQNAEKIQGDYVCFGVSFGKTGFVGRAYRKELDTQGRPAAWRIYGCLLSDRAPISCLQLLDILSSSFQTCEGGELRQWVEGHPCKCESSLSRAHSAIEEIVQDVAYRGCESFAFPFSRQVDDIDLVADCNGTVFKKYDMMKNKKQNWLIIPLALLSVASVIFGTWKMMQYRALKNDFEKNKIASENANEKLSDRNHEIDQLQKEKKETLNKIKQTETELNQVKTELNAAEQQLAQIKESGLPPDEKPTLDSLRAKDRAELEKILQKLSELKTDLEYFENAIKNLVENNQHGTKLKVWYDTSDTRK